MWAIVAIVAAFAGFWLARQLHRPEPQLASGTWLPQPREIGDFSVLDQAGRSFTRRELQGHPTLVFFGFTHCPDVCPTTLATLAQIDRTARIEGMRVLLVTVDPTRDTPAVLEKYVHAFDPHFWGATGSQAAIEKLAKEFSVAVNRVELPNGDYTMDHSAAVFLLDDRARIAGIFTPPFDVDAFAADLRAAAPRLKS